MINAILNHDGKEIEVNIGVKPKIVGIRKKSSSSTLALLAKINNDLFTSLYTWGASKEKICHALQISHSEFDILESLISNYIGSHRTR